MNRGDPSSIRANRRVIKHALLARNPAWQLPKIRAWRAAYDISFDWLSIFVSIWTVYRLGWVMAPLALLVVGNRQRALGNLLHEASHRNLSAHRQLNDYFAHVLLAPPLLSTLSVYRVQHAHHHAWLGDPQRDPDILVPPSCRSGQWVRAYTYFLTKSSLLRGSLAGHLSGENLNRRQRGGILAWWLVVGLSMMTINLDFALLFGALWFGARMTTFHAITTFREMTDHYGLSPGDIFSFTRDIPNHGLSSALLHPHNNGYHLTHHLFPTVPYYQLPAIQAQLSALQEYKDRAIVCPAYLTGAPSGVHGWGAHHG